MVTVLLVEDHPLFRDGFASMLQHRRPDWRLQVAGSAREALEILGNGAATDLVIVDINLPDLDGFQTVRAIAGQAPQTPRVMISGREDAAAQLRSRDCGAAGFISKAWLPEEIIAALERVLAGLTVFEAAPNREAPASRGALTPRQLEVLSLLAEGRSNKAIERQMGIAPRTVRAHLTEIFQILGVDGRVQAILQARLMGLIA
jgi:DNA-binding NarL/FixJ family response regulator